MIVPKLTKYQQRARNRKWEKRLETIEEQNEHSPVKPAIFINQLTGTDFAAQNETTR